LLFYYFFYTVLFNHKTYNYYMLEIVEAHTKRLNREFLKVPYKLFGGETSFIMTPFIFLRGTLIQAKNPYFANGKMVLLLAYQTEKQQEGF